MQKCREEFQTMVNSGIETGVCQLDKNHKGPHDCTVIRLGEPKSITGEGSELPALEDYWRCFHCDFATRDAAEAEAHFGDRDDPSECKPICLWWYRMTAEERVGELQQALQDLNYERMENYKADQQLRAMDLTFIGTLRRELFMSYDCKWNGYVRDVTAELEQDENVSRRAVNERIYKDAAKSMTASELKSAVSSPQQEWIEIKEGCEMPPPGKHVAISIEDANVYIHGWVTVGYFHSSVSGWWHGTPGDYRSCSDQRWTVTHWQPLPAPPVTAEGKDRG